METHPPPSSLPPSLGNLNQDDWEQVQNKNIFLYRSDPSEIERWMQKLDWTKREAHEQEKKEVRQAVWNLICAPANMGVLLLLDVKEDKLVNQICTRRALPLSLLMKYDEVMFVNEILFAFITEILNPKGDQSMSDTYICMHTLWCVLDATQSHIERIPQRKYSDQQKGESSEEIETALRYFAYVCRILDWIREKTESLKSEKGMWKKGSIIVRLMEHPAVLACFERIRSDALPRDFFPFLPDSFSPKRRWDEGWAAWDERWAAWKESLSCLSNICMEELYTSLVFISEPPLSPPPVPKWNQEEEQGFLNWKKKDTMDAASWADAPPAIKGNQTPDQCCRYWYTFCENAALCANTERGDAWEEGEDHLLFRTLSQASAISWIDVSRIFTRASYSKTASQCFVRWKEIGYSTKYRIHLNWTAEEDVLMKATVREHDRTKEPLSWYQVAEKFPGRTMEECRLYWRNKCNLSAMVLQDSTLRKLVSGDVPEKKTMLPPPPTRKRARSPSSPDQTEPSHNRKLRRERRILRDDKEKLRVLDEVVRKYISANEGSKLNLKWSQIANEFSNKLDLHPPLKGDVCCKEWSRSVYEMYENGPLTEKEKQILLDSLQQQKSGEDVKQEHELIFFYRSADFIQEQMQLLASRQTTDVEESMRGNLM
mmetsp:Transcript_20180/g.51525  ORF Transcript_20180/g.51525 Transcript_20180/m.51525 type:complete len:656 (-) Transcript_20180:792-2759(-)